MFGVQSNGFCNSIFIQGYHVVWPYSCSISLAPLFCYFLPFPKDNRLSLIIIFCVCVWVRMCICVYVSLSVCLYLWMLSLCVFICGCLYTSKVLPMRKNICHIFLLVLPYFHLICSFASTHYGAHCVPFFIIVFLLLIKK